MDEKKCVEPSNDGRHSSNSMLSLGENWMQKVKK